MFQKVQKPLEECIEELRQIANSHGRDREICLTDLKLRCNPHDIKKVVALCETLLYYNDKINEQ